MTHSRPLALVTGASSGIGAAFAELLAVNGYDLVVVARRKERLEELAARLGREHGAKVEVLAADLTVEYQRDQVEQRLRASERLELLVNNAGAGRYRRFVELNRQEARAILELEAVTPVLLTHAALSAMVERGRGAVINVASLLAFSGSLPPGQGMPQRATYAGGKSLIATFTRTLAHELEGTGVRVMVCCPGVVATEFHTVQGMDLSHLPRMSPEDVARAALAGLARGETLCVPGLEDPAKLDELVTAERALLTAAARQTEIASRYRSGDR